MSVASDFKQFILRGSVVDLAVGVVIGAAFGSVITAFVKDIITPLIGIPGKMSVGDIGFTINGSHFPVGDLINTIISFVLIALCVFFLIVRPVNWLMNRRKVEPAADPTTRECPFCLSNIPIKATRCAFCTSEVQPA